MDKILNKVAEILVECHYALRFIYSDSQSCYFVVIPESMGKRVKCDPFADTLEGRRQANAIEDWLDSNEWVGKHEAYGLWGKSGDIPLNAKLEKHQWRLDRIKLCLEQMVLDHE